MTTRTIRGVTYRVVSLDAAVELEAGAPPKEEQEEPEAEERDLYGFTAKQWGHIRQLTWAGYFKRTRTVHELSQVDHEWRQLETEERSDDDDDEDAGEASDETATEEQDMQEENDRQQLVKATYLELARELGEKPSVRLIVERAKVTGKYADNSVHHALAKLHAEGPPLPHWGERHDRGTLSRQRGKLEGKAEPSSPSREQKTRAPRAAAATVKSKPPPPPTV